MSGSLLPVSPTSSGTAATSTDDVSSAGKRDRRGFSRRRRGSAHCCDPSMARNIQDMSPWHSTTIAEPCLRAWDPLLILPGDIGLSRRGREIGDAVRAVDRSLGARRPSISFSVQPSPPSPLQPSHLSQGTHQPRCVQPQRGFRRNIGTMATCPARQSSDGNSLHVGAQGTRKRRRSRIDGAIRSDW